MRLLWLGTAGLVCVAMGAGQDEKASRPLAVTAAQPRLANVQFFVVSPSTLNFSAQDPDQGDVAASTPAQATFRITGGDPGREWWLNVAAATSYFAACGGVPVTAVSVSCASATVAPAGSTAVCAAPFALSTTPQRVAGGRQGAPGQFFYTVVISLTFRDSWSYVAQRTPPCTLTLNYSVNAP